VSLHVTDQVKIEFVDEYVRFMNRCDNGWMELSINRHLFYGLTPVDHLATVAPNRIVPAEVLAEINKTDNLVEIKYADRSSGQIKRVFSASFSHCLALANEEMDEQEETLTEMIEKSR